MRLIKDFLFIYLFFGLYIENLINRLNAGSEYGSASSTTLGFYRDPLFHFTEPGLKNMSADSTLHCKAITFRFRGR